MSREQLDAPQPEHEGEKYLRLLGLEDMADHDIPARGGTIKARDFLDVCGDHARPPLVGFESLSHEDPRYEPTRAALRGFIRGFIQGEHKSG